MGTLPSEQLPGLATDALSQGLDSPALRELAGTSPRDVRDARDFILVALSELGITLLDEQQVLWELVQSAPGQAALVTCSKIGATSSQDTPRWRLAGSVH